MPRALTAFLLFLVCTPAEAQVRGAGRGEIPPLPRDEIPAVFLHERPPLGMGTPPPFRTTATAERVRLGRRLFFDPILSIDRTVSCASCHDPRYGFASPVARPPGVRGRRATGLAKP